MKIFILSVLGFLLSAQLFAQGEDVNIMAQSPDGRTVKLIWVLNNRSNNITGFDIKRKEGIGDWVKLNSEPIMPGISLKNKLSLVESDKAEDSRIKAKLYKLLAEHKLKEISNSDYLEKLSKNDKDAAAVSAMMGYDYDIALISGFAFVDHTVKNKTDYQYALFVAGTARMLSKASWNYGEIPDLNVVTEITSRGSAKTKGIHVMWTADTAKMRSASVAGFNIYRQGIILNQVPIGCINAGNASEFEWYDKSANSTLLDQYSVSAQSVFGIEGIIKSYTYNPVEHTSDYKTPQANEVASLGYYFKDGMSVKWSFPAESERFLKGFYVEKNNMPDGYTRVSPLLDPGARSYIDKSGADVSRYIGVRVLAVYKDKTITTGVGRVYTYFSKRDPPAPQNLKVKSTIEDKKIAIKLHWDQAMNGDTVTEFYKIYGGDSASSRFELLNEKEPVRKTDYTWYAAPQSARTYEFYVAAVSKNNEQSIMSDTVYVQLPSIELPQPVISNAFAEGDKAVVQWQYPAVPDLKGFRIYQDKTLIAGEHDLSKDIREFRTPELANGNTYSFTIVAISDNNVESPVSAPIQVAIAAKRKK